MRNTGSGRDVFNGDQASVTGTTWRAKVPTAFSFVFAVVAAVCALSAISTVFLHGMQFFRVFIDMLIIPAPNNLAYAAFLAVLSAAVARRKRVAYGILLVFFGLQNLMNLLSIALMVFAGQFVGGSGRVMPIENHEGLLVASVIGELVTLVGSGVLIAARREFYGRSQRAYLPRAAATLAGLLVVDIALGFALVSAFHGSLYGAYQRLSYVVEKVLGGTFSPSPYFQLAELPFHWQGRPPAWVTLLLGLLGAATLFAALGILLRAQREYAAMRPEQEQHLRELLRDHGGRDSLGYFATRRDKAVVFAPNGRAAVTYRVVAGVSLASGDPIGDHESWPAAIASWREQARSYAWRPAAMGASEAGARAYASSGLKVLQLGDEAILRPRDFSLDGRTMRPVRQAVRRVERAGYTARVRRHADVSPEGMRLVAELAAHWRTSDSERGFSMALGRLGDPSDGRCVLVEAVDDQGRTAAMLSLCPWGKSGLSLDLMRRAGDADNGVTEFMVAALMREAPSLGVDRVSLNFAMFRWVFAEGARLGAGPVLRAWRRLLVIASTWWQLESLYLSNAKYSPEWSPRYLCFAERRYLATVAIASAAAEGFLPLRGATAAPLQYSGSPIGVTDVGDADERAPAECPLIVKAGGQAKVRLAKLAKVRATGADPYPVTFPRTDTLGAVRARHEHLGIDAYTGETVSVAGRVLLLRDHGGLCFATIRDFTGDLQVLLTAANTGDKALTDWKTQVDIGDHVGVTGEVITSRSGELTVSATSWMMTAKCLRPMPDKHHGLADPEARVRQRYLDLATREQARDQLRVRGAILHSLRGTLVDRDYLEVETPMLQSIHGGANARPFVTHINAYDTKLYLRIAPELHLKQLAVGGVDRIFELGRVFRNEGVSAKHNPEFTMLEAYQSYADYDDMLALCRTLIQRAATAAYGKPIARHPSPDGGFIEYDLSGSWRVKTVNEALSEAVGEQVTADTSIEDLQKLCDRHQIRYDPAAGRGAVLLEMYEHLVEDRTVLPTFYKDFPTDVSPLTRPHRTDGRLAERWDLVAFGVELGTAYSELIDPYEQRRRLTEQSLLAAHGDMDAMELNEEFLTALEYGMPPTGGLGIGVDRLVMLLTGRSIRETVAFPFVRPTTI